MVGTGGSCGVGVRHQRSAVANEVAGTMVAIQDLRSRHMEPLAPQFVALRLACSCRMISLVEDMVEAGGPRFSMAFAVVFVIRATDHPGP